MFFLEEARRIFFFNGKIYSFLSSQEKYKRRGSISAQEFYASIGGGTPYKGFILQSVEQGT